VFFVSTVTNFSAEEKDRGVKFCTRVRLLSGQVFSHFGELWLAGSHSGGITSGMYASRQGLVGSWNWGRGRRVRPYGGICILQACRRTSFLLSISYILLIYNNFMLMCHHHHTTTILRPFSGTTRVSRCQKGRTSGLYGARED